MSELYGLPEGWEWRKLVDVANISNKTVTISDDEEYNCIGLEHIESNTGKLIDYSLSNGNEIKSSKVVFVEGMVLYGKLRPYLNKVWTAEFDGIATTEILPFKPRENVLDSEYLSHYLRTNYFVDNAMKNISGARMPRITTKYIKSEVKIPLPPLQEQKRIVAKLDSLFAKIDQAIALHQQNIDDADALMGSVLNEVFGELEERYELDSIGNMIEILTDYHSNGAYKTLKANVELLDNKDYALMIRATDLENNDYENNVKYITEKAYNFMAKSKVYGGEIILPKIGTIGSVYFMPYLDRPVSLAMNIFMIRCSENVDNKYLFSYLKSPRGYDDIINRSNGAVTKTITKDAVRSIKLPFPPLAVQQKTVTYLDQLSQKTEKLKQAQQEKMQSLKDLKASLLDRAFRGKL